MPKFWRCERCGKEFGRYTFSHAMPAIDNNGNVVPYECGPVVVRGDEEADDES